jgi:hypothetical protein
MLLQRIRVGDEAITPRPAQQQQQHQLATLSFQDAVIHSLVHR